MAARPFNTTLENRLKTRISPGGVEDDDIVGIANRLGRAGKIIQMLDVSIHAGQRAEELMESGHVEIMSAGDDCGADFDTEEPYLVVNLDENCRRQQVGEGWFKNLDEVPRQAISMSVRQILKAREIICTVPDLRKAKAVHACVTGDISPWHPASILRRHPKVTLYLDNESASLLNQREGTKPDKTLSYAGS